MAILNPSFETVDPAATTEFGPGGVGRALNWLTFVRLLSVTFEIAGFTAATADEYPWETFEGRWNANESYLYAFTDPSTQLEQPLFFSIYAAPKTLEDFSEGWSLNEYYVFEGSTTPAPFNSVPYAADLEAFSAEWSGNESYLYSLGSTTAAQFAAVLNNYENFNDDWVTSYKYSFVGVGTDLTAASFDTTPQSYEDFEEDWSSLVMTTI